ncbi:MAG: hypothetical protein H0X34_06020 [Chthoniobacterales bacterium]|nr:hypothetical protein [Chthoniobacterales bacterium]
MPAIDRVYIATHKGDLRLTRICVASVRAWYPRIPIFLLKDEVNGSFDTREIEARWNVGVWKTEGRAFGWGFIKLEPLFGADKIRYLILDSDIVFLGRVIDALEHFDTDFVVQQETQAPTEISRLYFDALRVRATLNPSFAGNPFTFNTGQYVATSGLILREDFKDLVDWAEPRRVRYPEMFNPSDQGVLNYVLGEMASTGAITVTRSPFMKWGREEIAQFDVDELNSDSPYPFLIHWAGLKHVRLRRMPRADILRHFEDMYYERIPLGWATSRLRIAEEEGHRWRGRVQRLLRRMMPPPRAA